MAIASYIQPNNALSVGASEPDGNSINSLRNYRNPAIAIEQQTGMQELADWFILYSQNDTISTKPYRFAQFRGGVVFRVYVESLNPQSCNAPYFNVSNGSFAVRVFGGGGTGFFCQNVSGLSNSTIGEGQLYSQSGLGGGGSPETTYSFLIRDLTTNMQTTTISVVMRCDNGSITRVIYDGVNYGVGSSFWSIAN